MFLQRKIKVLLWIGIFLNSFTYSQVDTNFFYRQWQDGLNLMDKHFSKAHLSIENAIFGFANHKYWNSAIHKAMVYSKILLDKNQKEYAKKWLHYAGEWAAEKLGKQNFYYCQVLENASLLNFLNGDFFTAYQLLKKSLKIYQKCENIDAEYLLKLHQNIATWSENMGNWEDAYSSYHYLYHFADNSKDYLEKLAHIAHENMDYWNAKDYLLMLIKEKYRDSTVYLKLAECYLHLNKTDSAELFFNLYDKKVKDLPTSAFSIRYFEIKAWMARQAQAFQEAIDALQLGLQHPDIQPIQKIQFYWYIGKIWSDLGLLENAEAQYKNAINSCSDTLFLKYVIYKDLAEVYLKKGLLAKAEDLLVISHNKFHYYLGRFHTETLYVDELLGKLYFQKKDYEKSLYFYHLALDNYRYHHDLQTKTLKIYRKIIANWQHIYQQKQNYQILKQILSLWKTYIQWIDHALRSPNFEEELFFELQSGLFEATEAFLEAYFRKGQIQHLHAAYYTQWLWKKIKQKSLQYQYADIDKYQNLITRKKLLHALILQESIKPNSSAMKLGYWNIQLDSVNQEIKKQTHIKSTWFDPQTKSFFSTEKEECQVAYFMGSQSWLIFVHYQEQLFFQYYPDNYEIRNYLYLLKKGNENPDNVSITFVLERISQLMLEFPLKIIQKNSKIKTINFSLDDSMFHLDLEKLYLPNSKQKTFLSQKYYLQKKLVPFK